MKVKFYVVSMLLLASINSHSAEFKGGISTLATGPNLGDFVYIKVENHSSSASWSTGCATDNYWSFKFETSSTGGKEAYSLLLSAYASGKKVVIAGTGGCEGKIGDDIQNLGYTRFDF